MARTRTQMRAPLVNPVSTTDDAVTLLVLDQLVAVNGSGLVCTS